MAPRLHALASLATLALPTLAAPPHKGFPPSLAPGFCLQNDSQKPLWCPGDGGYGCFKIPSLLRTPTSLLAFIEARKYSCDDHGFIDLLLRRSFDNGTTWSPATVVHSNSTESDWHTVGDALPVRDAATGAIQLIFTIDNLDVMHTTSVDDGASWAAPTNISSVALVQRGPFVGTGHAGGLQLANGDLLVPLYGGAPTHSYVLSSEDGGANWRVRSELAAGNEWAMAEVQAGTGRLLGSMRPSDAQKPFAGQSGRLQSWSNDSGVTWSEPEHVRSLIEPVKGCEGSLLLHPNGKLYFGHPDPPLGLFRTRFNIKVSADQGRTWALHTQVWGEESATCVPPCVPAAGYSSMVAMGDGVDAPIGLLYDRNNVSMVIFEAREVAFTTVSV